MYNSLVQRPSSPEEGNNPLRMLRQGLPVRPKMRGNKQRNGTLDRSRASLGFDPTTHQTLPRGFKHSKVPPPVKPKPIVTSETERGSVSSVDSDSANNPLPLPPRDRSKNSVVTQAKPRHHRKHPLIIPNSLLRSHVASSESRLVIQHTHNPSLETQEVVPSSSPSSSSDRSNGQQNRDSSSQSPKVPPAKPPRLYNTR